VAVDRTTPNVFIIESLKLEDESDGHFEGRFLEHILKLAGREVRYFYIRTRKEFIEILDQFETSRFRYLHISCHGNRNGIALTFDELSINELAADVVPYLDERRLFLSACEIVTPSLAKALLRHSGCYSVIGPSRPVYFDEAALFWASLYHFLFRTEATAVKRLDLQKNLRRLSTIFDLGMKYYAASSNNKGFSEVSIRPK
jgi:hypothetical protein